MRKNLESWLVQQDDLCGYFERLTGKSARLVSQEQILSQLFILKDAGSSLVVVAKPVEVEKAVPNNTP